ncbi:serine/threonine-protein kinase pim-2-like [Oratosquilla oratoria]|uniref:serine/threonine-protein kinase pim-2-like n=1 Tax=Oratosquilla oratoria TaxID=337810 RepID=UPI003F771778
MSTSLSMVAAFSRPYHQIVLRGLKNLRAMTERFVFQEVLGKGAFGCVFSAEEIENKAKVAVKKIPFAEIYDWVDPKKRTMPLEVALMKTVQHVLEVIKLFDFFMERGYVFMVMELIAGAMDLRAYTS